MWRIDEGPDEENKPQITGKIEIAIQIVGDTEAYHPRICWHSHKQVKPYTILTPQPHNINFARQVVNIQSDFKLYPAGDSICWNWELCLKNRHD